MHTKNTTGTKRVQLTIAIAVGLTLQTGCGAMLRKASGLLDCLHIRSNTARDLADIRKDTRDELAEQREELRRVAAEREVQLARAEAERARLEMELCKANTEALQRQARGNIRDSVETKTVFNVSHSLELNGPIKVNQEALRREQANPPEAQRRPPQQSCSCCDKTCGCGSGQTRRHCHICKHRKCEAENDCGGPEALRRAEQEALQRPPQVVRVPVDVPMMISLTLNNPSMEATRITREPMIGNPPSCVCTDPVDPNCPKPPEPKADNCVQPMPQEAAPVAPPAPMANPAAPNAAPKKEKGPLPPPPVVDPSAFRTDLFGPPAIVEDDVVPIASESTAAGL